MRQKASEIWAEVMHNFARVLMMDLYSLPAELINQWTEIMNIYQTDRSLINMGQWALTYRLQEQTVDPTPGAAAASEPPTVTSTFAAEAPVEADWDELPGSFFSQAGTTRSTNTHNGHDGASNRQESLGAKRSASRHHVSTEN